MRVLMVSKALVVAAYRSKLTELARLGVEVIAVVPREWREGGTVQRLEPWGDEVDVVPADLRWNGHFHLHYYPDLPRLVRRYRPDLLHADEEPYNLATLHALLAAGTIPSVFFTWQNILRRYPPPFSWMERTVYRRTSHAIAGNSDAAGVLRAKGYTGPVSVIPQFGVDPEFFSPGKAPPAPFTVGFLNRLTPGKGLDLTLDAVTAMPDVWLEIVGDGPLRAGLDEEIAQRRLNDRVRVRSRLPSARMPALLRSLHAVILPSRTTPSWKEQFGRILVEAMACGVPVIGSDSGEIPHVIGDAGLVVPEGDGDALAAALRRLQDDDLRRDLGQRGRARVLERFTQRRIAERTVEVYRSVLESRG